MKIGIIGTGFVGSAAAFSLIIRGVAEKVVLIDRDKKKAEAEAEDIAHASAFAAASKIVAGDYKDLEGAGIVVITAGASQKGLKNRFDSLELTVKIFKDIIPEVVKYAPDAILLIASNPVDVMTAVALKISKFPPSRVIGSGTALDSSRFKTLVGYHLGISPQSVHAYVLGEHGDSEVLAWSNADAGNLQIEKIAKELKRPITAKTKKEIDNNVRNAGYKIVEGKGATYYGIAAAITKICQAVISNEHAILTISSMHKNIEGVKDVCLSMPTIVGKKGVHKVITPHLSKSEQTAVKKSAKTLKDFTKKAFEFLGSVSKLNFSDQMKEDPKRKSGVYTLVHEHLSIGSDRAVGLKKQFRDRP